MMVWVVIANYFSIQIWNDHVSSASLSEGPVTSVTANSIVSMDNAFPIFIEASNQVEGIVGKESSSIKSLGNKMGH